MNGPALAQQTKLVEAAKQAGTIKQFFPSEFSAYGAIGELRIPTLSVTSGMHAELSQLLPAYLRCMQSCKQMLPAHAHYNAGEDSVPLLFGPKAKTRQAIEAAGLPHTYVVSYGFASYWANGLGELSQKRDRVPPAPTGDNKVPYFGSGRTKCESLRPSHPQPMLVTVHVRHNCSCNTMAGHSPHPVLNGVQAMQLICVMSGSCRILWACCAVFPMPPMQS